MTITYKTVLLGGKVRLTRAPSVLSPLPYTRCGRGKLVRAARVSRDQERTVSKPSPRIWTPGYVLTRVA